MRRTTSGMERLLSSLVVVPISIVTFVLVQTGFWADLAQNRPAMREMQHSFGKDDILHNLIGGAVDEEAEEAEGGDEEVAHTPQSPPASAATSAATLPAAPTAPPTAAPAVALTPAPKVELVAQSTVALSPASVAVQPEQPAATLATESVPPPPKPTE
mmetsp:Transcript_25164/g.63522  ORF Transcript_25164/g.63522 Transcript_25164/m.63522 type:complete len:158 (-) Transcript_25164:10-483(-)